MKGLYSIHDLRAGEFSPPSAFESAVGAWRQFADWCADPKSVLNKYPLEFVLVCIGELDQETGKLKGYDVPVQVVTAEEIRRVRAQQESVKGNGVELDRAVFERAGVA